MLKDQIQWFEHNEGNGNVATTSMLEIMATTSMLETWQQLACWKHGNNQHVGNMATTSMLEMMTTTSMLEMETWQRYDNNYHVRKDDNNYMQHVGNDM